MALSSKPYKGARDFYPEDKRLQKYMFGVLRNVAESYGYNEYDAPILESFEIFAAKSGQEIVDDQTYVFEDRGGRKVVVRPEMTPTVSRMVAAKRQELAYPLRWYSIPNLWRYERPQRGRLREHWQLNVDIFGIENYHAEIELLSMISDMFKAFGAKTNMYEIRINSRKLINYILEDYLGLSEQESHDICKLIDKMHKIDRSKFISGIDAVLSPEHKEGQVNEKLLSILEAKRLQDLPAEVMAHDSVVELDQVLSGLEKKGINNALFDVTIMRGFDYYTGIVFEAVDKHLENNRSMLGGGRYDGLVGLFGVASVPTVGFGWGDVTLENFLKLHHLLPDLVNETSLYVCLVGDVAGLADDAINEFRKQGVNIAVDYSGKKLGDQIKNADKAHIKHVLIVGEDEVNSGKFKIKNLESGKEYVGTITELVKELE
ncbi:histidine--tRNA ligase [bacterium]|nr:histidine--tRNA ligase [bacterium]